MRRAIAWLTVAAVLLAVVVVAGAAGGATAQLTQTPGNFITGGCSWSLFAQRDIPARYAAIYAATGAAQQLDCTVLAAIGRVETNHGRLHAPGVTSGANFAGAKGPCQFLQPTWDMPGVGLGGDIYSPEDCIPAIGRYLRMGGAPADYRAAVFSYNHADWYVAEVLAWAARYRGTPDVAAAPVDLQPGMTPKQVIDAIVLPIAARCCSIARSPAQNDAANAVHGPTTSGGRSDHQGPPSVAWAADLSNSSGGNFDHAATTPEMDELADVLARTFGVPWSPANPVAETTVGGYRFQELYRTDAGGGHWNHVHFGVRIVAVPA